jgi:Tfp pilus assembly protein PilO
MRLLDRSSTRRLTDSPIELTAQRRWRRGLMLMLALLLVAASALAGWRYFEQKLAPLARLAELEAENQRLRVEADATRIELEMERATRAELKRQVVELNEQVSQLTHKLEFFNSQAKTPK